MISTSSSKSPGPPRNEKGTKSHRLRHRRQIGVVIAIAVVIIIIIVTIIIVGWSYIVLFITVKLIACHFGFHRGAVLKDV